MIFIVFGAYHSYFVYKDDLAELKEHQEEGKNCLLEFKVQQCNPLNMTDECQQLANCFQKADNDEGSVGMAMEVVQKTSRSLSETLMGPIMIILFAFAASQFRFQK